MALTFKVMPKPVVTTIEVGGADTRQCASCKSLTFWVSRSVPLYSTGGVRFLNVLICESHPVPTSITEGADGAYVWAFDDEG